MLDFVFRMIGVILALKFPAFSLARNVNQLPRQIPTRSSVKVTVVPYLLSTGFVYSTVAGNVHSLMMASWTGAPLIVDLSSLLASFMAAAIEIVVLGIVTTFLRLSMEDHRWWWPAFNSAAGAGVVFLIYAVYFAIAIWTPSSPMSVMVYLAIVGISFLVFGLCVGSLSFAGSFCFVQFLYNSLKTE
jgi:transmembrane 9 superfamily protein 2/4